MKLNKCRSAVKTMITAADPPLGCVTWARACDCKSCFGERLAGGGCPTQNISCVGRRPQCGCVGRTSQSLLMYSALPSQHRSQHSNQHRLAPPQQATTSQTWRYSFGDGLCRQYTVSSDSSDIIARK